MRGTDCRKTVGVPSFLFSILNAHIIRIGRRQETCCADSIGFMCQCEYLRWAT